MQDARITFLTTPEAKAAITAKAAKRGMSMGEYIRLAVEAMPEESQDEQELAMLVAEVNRAIPAMAAALDHMIMTLQQTHGEVDSALRAAGIRT